MRIDKIIDSIVKKVFSPVLINGILEGKISWKFKILWRLISLKKRLLLWKEGKFMGLTNIEGKEEFYISDKSFSLARKAGISAFAKLKNAEDFLVKTVLSVLNYVDEVVLIMDPSSEDKTEEICKELSEKYNKVKFYRYPVEVYFANHPKYINTQDNSLHSISYYLNYGLSKTTHEYILILDDDMLCLEDSFKNIVKNIQKNNFNIISQINISKEENKFMIANKYLSSGIAGIFGDHGIFKITPYTYYYKDIGAELLLHPYSFKRLGIGFLHLKNLKPGGGMKNFLGYGVEFIKKLNSGTTYVSLPEKYIKKLNQRGIE